MCIILFRGICAQNKTAKLLTAPCQYIELESADIQNTINSADFSKRGESI